MLGQSGIFFIHVKQELKHGKMVRFQMDLGRLFSLVEEAVQIINPAFGETRAAD